MHCGTHRQRGGRLEIQFSHKTRAVPLPHPPPLITIIICLEGSDAKVKKCVVIPKFASVKWKTSNNIAAYAEGRQQRGRGRGRGSV